MTKLCSVCGTENREEAQFCRSCGTAFPPPSPASTDESQLAAGITCDECGFQNKPGIRYCANCGVSLLGTVIVPRSRAVAAEAGGGSPPPISYPSYAPVAPYPPAPPGGSMYPPVAATSGHTYPPGYDEQTRADLPDPAAAMAATRPLPVDEEDEPRVTPSFAAPAADAPKRAPMMIALVVLVLVAVGAAAWWFMGNRGTPRVEAGAASAPVVAAPPVVAEPPVLAAPPPVAASAPEVVVAPPEPVASAVLAPPATTAMPPVAEPPPAQAADPEAQRIAAEKRREKAARDKAEREAKAKALVEQQQQQAAATARAEQEAARRRAEEAQRARPVVTAPPPAAPQARTAQEVCAGRGTIAEAICQSRECASAEHAGEALCRQIKEREDRRRNYMN
jgi:hypothetical protein